MPPQIINIPPAAGTTIKPAGGEFAFYVTATTNVCFGTASPAGSFPDLEDETFEWLIGSTHTFPIPADVGAELPYNTSNPGNVCTAVDPTANGKVIIVGSSMQPKPQAKTKSKPKPKKKAAVKKASKKANSKAAAKRKAAPKKAAKKSKAKPKSKAKAKAKPKGKKKSAKKSRR
jgi:hypothetical protein